MFVDQCVYERAVMKPIPKHAWHVPKQYHWLIDSKSRCYNCILCAIKCLSILLSYSMYHIGHTQCCGRAKNMKPYALLTYNWCGVNKNCALIDTKLFARCIICSKRNIYFPIADGTTIGDDSGPPRPPRLQPIYKALAIEMRIQIRT